MFQRLRWMAVGAAGGVGASVWVRRKARSMAARYTPGGRAAEAADRLRAWPVEVREAIRDGRTAMRQREDELRGRYPGGATVTEIAPRRAEVDLVARANRGEHGERGSPPGPGRARLGGK